GAISAVSAIDSTVMFVADGRRIRRIDSNTNVTTITTNTTFDSYVDGPAPGIGTLRDLKMDSRGNVYFTHGNAVRKMTPSGFAVTMGGGVQSGLQDGAAFNSAFYAPSGIAIAPNGDIYIADTYNEVIRKIVLPTETVFPSSILGISVFAGITITGTPGAKFRIESSINAQDWTPVGEVRLIESPFLFIDKSSTNRPTGLYRAVLLH
ncbi:MAG TPA: hypothetical protein VEC37_13720, partial [Bacillota bacterium]|nr:hypothetical protein [Bacillota bacterium]